MHDPLCAAAVLQPDLMTWEPAYVDVELAGSLTLGETVAYFQGSEARARRFRARGPNVQAAARVDAKRFIELYLECVGNAFGS